LAESIAIDARVKAIPSTILIHVTTNNTHTHTCNYVCYTCNDNVKRITTATSRLHRSAARKRARRATARSGVLRKRVSRGAGVRWAASACVIQRRCATEDNGALTRCTVQRACRAARQDAASNGRQRRVYLALAHCQVERHYHCARLEADCAHALSRLRASTRARARDVA